MEPTIAADNDRQLGDLPEPDGNFLYLPIYLISFLYQFSLFNYRDC